MLHGVTQSLCESEMGGWIGAHWVKMRERRLIDVTLPGSHNSGNVRGELSSDCLYDPDYRFNDYLEANLEGRISPLEKIDFDERFICWNENHNNSICQQLEMGSRWFHLKLCVTGPETDLSQVLHCHRGYTNKAESFATTISNMRKFLEREKYEFLVLGLNNLYGVESESERLAFLSAISEAFGGPDSLIPWRLMQNVTLEELVSSGRRVAIFAQTIGTIDSAVEKLGIIPSGSSLTEQWDSSMSSGNLSASSEWLFHNMVTEALPSKGKYYVLQANPNDADTNDIYPNMYTRINSGDAPRSLSEWLYDFLQSLSNLVTRAAASQPQLRINAISTDFFEYSRPLSIALRLNGLLDDAQSP